MAGRLTARLEAMERRLRPAVQSGIRAVLVRVPQSELSTLGEPCREHPDCSVRWSGPVGTHFQAAEVYGR
jgi:hypothetical protein